ncbi:hypothetical protein HMI56_007435, partial [Coelomomyces lativittatus]
EYQKQRTLFNPPSLTSSKDVYVNNTPSNSKKIKVNPDPLRSLTSLNEVTSSSLFQKRISHHVSPSSTPSNPPWVPPSLVLKTSHPPFVSKSNLTPSTNPFVLEPSYLSMTPSNPFLLLKEQVTETLPGSDPRLDSITTQLIHGLQKPVLCVQGTWVPIHTSEPWFRSEPRGGVETKKEEEGEEKEKEKEDEDDEDEDEDEDDPWCEARLSANDLKLSQLIVSPSSISDMDPMEERTVSTNPPTFEESKNTPLDIHLSTSKPLLDTMVTLSEDKVEKKKKANVVHLQKDDDDDEDEETMDLDSPTHGPSFVSSDIHLKSVTNLTPSVSLSAFQPFSTFQPDLKSLPKRILLYSEGEIPWPDTLKTPSLSASCHAFLSTLSTTPSSLTSSSSSSSSLSTSMFPIDMDACLYYFMSHPELSLDHWSKALDHLVEIPMSSFYYLHAHVGMYVTPTHVFIQTAWKGWLNHFHHHVHAVDLHPMATYWVCPLPCDTPPQRSAFITFLKAFQEWETAVPRRNKSHKEVVGVGSGQGQGQGRGQGPSSLPTLISTSPFLHGTLEKAQITRCGPVQQMHGISQCLQIDGYVLPTSFQSLYHHLQRLRAHDLHLLNIQVDYEPLAQFFPST